MRVHQPPLCKETVHMHAAEIESKDKDTGNTGSEQCPRVMRCRDLAVAGKGAPLRGRSIHDARYSLASWKSKIGVGRDERIAVHGRKEESLCPPAEEGHEARAEHHAADREDELSDAPLNHLLVENELVRHELWVRRRSALEGKKGDRCLPQRGRCRSGCPR